MSKEEEGNSGFAQSSEVEWSAPPVTEAAAGGGEKPPVPGGGLVGEEEMAPKLCEDA